MKMFNLIAILMLIGVAACKKHEVMLETKEITVDEVFSWKTDYLKYLNKNVSVLLKDLGKPIKEDLAESYSVYSYDLGVSSRTYKFGFDKNGGRIEFFAIYPNDNEVLDINKVLVEAQIFTFKSGKYSDSTHKYFVAEDVDGNNLQFTVNQSSLTFARLMFTKKTRNE